ncbi:MAG: DUF427 domain-containing protein, partial [Chloroflexi bacterium]|nr:DUF427 domain-containing protein [Chloroflexota bacterium]
RNAILAEGEVDHTVLALEGAYYFDASQVDMANLVVSERTYTCPYKGLCHWIDLMSDTGVIRDVGWVYTKPDHAYEYIRDKVGFQFGMRPGVIVEKT